MATVTGYTAARMKQIEDSAIVGGTVVGNNLVLTRYNNSQITAGNVRGPQGIQGPQGVTSIVPCTSTTRPTGAALFTGLEIYESDTKKVYIWDGTVWVYQGGPIVCTSITRPSTTNLPLGTQIFETDTSKVHTWNGTVWLPPAGCELGRSRLFSDIQGITNAWVSANSVSFNLPVARRIGIAGGAHYYKSSGDGNAITVTGLFIDGTWIIGRNMQLLTSNNAAMHLEERINCSSGAHTASYQVYNNFSFMNVAASATLTVTDYGPPTTWT